LNAGEININVVPFQVDLVLDVRVNISIPIKEIADDAKIGKQTL